jgi:hypothetical protein
MICNFHGTSATLYVFIWNLNIIHEFEYALLSLVWDPEIEEKPKTYSSLQVGRTCFK